MAHYFVLGKPWELNGSVFLRGIERLKRRPERRPERSGGVSCHCRIIRRVGCVASVSHGRPHVCVCVCVGVGLGSGDWASCNEQLTDERAHRAPSCPACSGPAGDREVSARRRRKRPLHPPPGGSAPSVSRGPSVSFASCGARRGRRPAGRPAHPAGAGTAVSTAERARGPGIYGRVHAGEC